MNALRPVVLTGQISLCKPEFCFSGWMFGYPAEGDPPP